ncbi:MAG: hypothetical protein KJZ60_00850, partial [Ignavibacteriaceae bacterium]|nr:hypothetical protein [Ignavibacteriaceae bacterium]
TIPQRIAIEVAAQTENISILEEAAKVKSEPIRAIAVQHIYYLWRQNPETGFALLDNLSKEVKGRWLLPRNEILQSCLALSLTILFNHYKQPDTVYTLQKIWRRILDDVFLINPKQFGSWQETLKAKIRELLLVGVTKFILRNLAQLPKEQTLGIADIQHFWQGPDREKRFVLFKELTKVLDLETCNTKEMHQALMQAVENRDMFCTYLTLIAMTTSLLERPDETLPVIREFFEAGQQIKPAPPAFGYTPWVLAVTMDRQKKINPKFWEMFEDMVEHILNTTEGIWYSAENMYRFMYLHSHDRLNDRMLDDELPSQLARNFLDKKIKEKDFNLLKDYIDRELTYSNSIQLIVAALKFILSYNIKDAQVTESIAKLLRRGRIYYPEEVEDFLSEADVPLEIRNEVQMQGTSERLHDLWSYQALTFFEDTILFSRKSNSARTLYWLFNRATECRDLSEWLILFFKGVINLLYGGPVFPDIKFESSNH